MKKKSIYTQQRDDHFKEQFSTFYDLWKNKDKKKNTQGEFARQICKIREKKNGERCPVTNSYVSEWLRGIWFPEEYLPEIAEVLGIEVKDLIIHTYNDKYQKSTEYVNKLGNEEITPFCEEIGLDLGFLQSIRKILGSNFDDMFPTWTEIIPNNNILDYKYIRRKVSSWSVSAEMDGDLRVLQHNIVDEDGETKKLILFTREDLRFLKDMQSDILDYIEYLMMKREKDLQREVDEANKKSTLPLEGGGIGFRPLSAEELNAIDRYHDYHYRYSNRKDGTDNG